ncbi:hypothetical protein [Aquitalea sp. ASV15]|uniref:hypothetical protein n=1 Tax=Aquitalea sp. ASV15 TaxID=2795104 RepID=UPI001E32BF5B|nr:hypothetical protein [Aquitalea sp. ASV15]
MTIAELDRLREESKSMVTKRATLSAGTSAIPTPGVDVAADVAILLELIPAINRKFGLTSEQIEGYDPAVKQIIFQVIKRAGLAMVGTEVTKQLILQALKKVAGRAVTKQVLKFVPLVGWAVNAAIGFGAMKYVGNSHVDDCYDVCRRVIESTRQI